MTFTWEKYLQEKLIDEETLSIRIKELGRQISQDYRHRDLLLICILKGRGDVSDRPDAPDHYPP